MISIQQIQEMVLAVADTEVSNSEELCRLDSFVGDGDHGFTVARGFKAVKSALEGKTFSSAAEVMNCAGEALTDTMGGAIGLIIGGLFTGGAEAISDVDEIKNEDIYKFLEAGLIEIKAVGGATEGDRTLVDALSPAVSAYKLAIDEGVGIQECFTRAAEAAAEGAANTANMVARHGRARFLREKSLGYVDAGATTMKLAIEAMRDYVVNNL